MAHAAAKLSELQNRASSVSVLVPQRSFASILTDVANELRDKGVLHEEESFIDATFAMAKAYLDLSNQAWKRHVIIRVDRHVLPLSVSTHAAIIM